jgi:hypothetical protein
VGCQSATSSSFLPGFADHRAWSTTTLTPRRQANCTTSNCTQAVRERDDSTVLYEDQHPYAGGYYALYCEDPEGSKVEIPGPE